jgi:hypothetical protein
MLLAIFWYDAATHNRQRRFSRKPAREPHSSRTQVQTLGLNGASPSPQVSENPKAIPAITLELIQSLKPLLEVMRTLDHAQAQSALANPSTSRLKDLVHQSQRIGNILSQIESLAQRQESKTAAGAAKTGQSWIRQAPRQITVNPLTISGQDVQKKSFETLSYTLNTSPFGACIILPEQMIQVGQTLSVYDQHIGTQASVRWLANSKKGGMLVAGIRFAKPLPSLIPAIATA